MSASGATQMTKAQPAGAEQDEPSRQKKTMSSKILAAIALERVTGRKPDPSRLADLN